jgi:hypothetical protein
VKLTKIDVAEAHLVTAVRLRFRDEHPASIYLLAGSAREILTSIGEKTGVRTMLAGLAETTGKPIKELKAAAHDSVNFLKHADRNPSAVLDDLDDEQVGIVLFIACHDFHRVTGGQPIELQVYEAWWHATSHRKVSDAPLRGQPRIRACLKIFPGIRSAAKKERLKIGLDKLDEARLNPRYAMQIRREVIILKESPASEK